MYHQCSSLESFYFPAGVTEIPKGEGQNYGFFYKCYALSEVTFGSNETMTTIGVTAFRYCTALEYITIPDSVTYVDTNAFRESGLKATPFSHNSKLSGMGEHVFYKCASLETAFIPKNVTAFHNCTSNDGGLFDRCTSLTTVTFHEESEFESFGGRCFYGCSSLVNFEFPSTTTFIGQYSFNSAAITSIVIPHSTKTIEKYAFQSCSKVTEIRLSPNFTRANKSAFYKTGTKCVYIPVTASYFEEHCFGTAEGGMGTQDMVFFYCGTQDDFANITFENNNQRISNALRINWGYDADGNALANPTEQYYKTLATNSEKCYIVFGYNPCAAFYENNHSGQEKVKFAGDMFLTDANVCVECSRCLKETVTDTKSALFANKGYSKSIYGQIIQGFGINKTEFQFYKDKFGDIKYGLVAGVYSYVDNEETKYVHQSGELLALENGSLVAKNKVATVSFDDKLDYDVFEMRVGGLVDDLATTKLFCCAYVVAKDTIYYINNEKTYEGSVQGAVSILEIEN
jgi:hypothetical protein